MSQNPSSELSLIQNVEYYAKNELAKPLQEAFNSAELQGIGGNFTTAARKLFGGLRKVVDFTETQSRIEKQIGGRITGPIKKLAAKAGATILVDVLVPLIPLGAASLAGPLIRPLIRRVLYYVSDAVIDTIVSDRNADPA